MQRPELLQLMAAQIFAALVAERGQSLLGTNIEAVAKEAVGAAKAIEAEVTKQMGPRGAGVPPP